MAVSSLGQAGFNANHGRAYEEGGHEEVQWLELAPPQWEHFLLHNEEQATQGGLMEHWEYQADNHQYRQGLYQDWVELLYQNSLSNDFKELQAQNGGVHGNAPEYLEQY